MRKLRDFDLGIESIKVYLGIILAIAGPVLVFLGAQRVMNLGGFLGYLAMVLGVALVGAYCFLTWDGYQEIFGEDAAIALFALPLATFGVLMVFLSVNTTWMVPPHDKIFLAFGVALVVIPIAFLVNYLREDIVSYLRDIVSYLKS